MFARQLQLPIAKFSTISEQGRVSTYVEAINSAGVVALAAVFLYTAANIFTTILMKETL